MAISGKIKCSRNNTASFMYMSGRVQVQVTLVT
jgi:hypothetical protein